MASVRWREDRSTWEVTWKEPVGTVDENGVEHHSWVARRRKAPTRKAAEDLKREVESVAATGKPWEDGRKAPVVTIGALCAAYIKASNKGRPAATSRFRASVLQRFLDWAGENRRASDLTTGLLADYAQHLATAGVKSAARYVGLVEQLWMWGHNRADTYPGIPSPKRITGADGEVRQPAPPVAVDTPTWADVDAMLYALTPDGAVGEGQGYGHRPQWAFYRRVAVVMRFTGLRVSQVLSLDWADLDLDRARLTIRADVTGAKGQSRHRVVPLHPALVAELAGWGVRQGPVFGRVATKGKNRGKTIVPRSDEVDDVIGAAWKRAGVAQAKWAAVGRENNRQTNAIRARWKSTIAEATSYDLATIMVGQATRHGEHDAYVAMGTPEASPYWARMIQAIKAIPEIDPAPSASNIVALPAT